MVKNLYKNGQFFLLKMVKFLYRIGHKLMLWTKKGRDILVEIN